MMMTNQTTLIQTTQKTQFTQPQYTFHLTETRLKSNLIGSVQAHDADLNDTIQYSLFGDYAHLFDVSSNGQLSLRSSIKQLNISSCQLIVQATDTLGAPLHSQQARVNLHVAPQLVGRSINFDHNNNNNNQLADSHSSSGSEAKLFNSRSLLEQSTSTDQPNNWPHSNRNNNNLPGGSNARTSHSGQHTNKDSTSYQRSSVATVMSSLQHMVRSVNLLDMPMSSALLLSALLAFLVCLLLIIVISMSVHLYKRRSKARQARRQRLAAAAHLRHAHLASAIHSPASSSTLVSSVTGSVGGGIGSAPSGSVGAALARADRARYQHNQRQQQHNNYRHNQHGSHHIQQHRSLSSGSSDSHSSSNSSPTNSTVAGDNDSSPTNYSSPRDQQNSQSPARLLTVNNNNREANKNNNDKSNRMREQQSSFSSSSSCRPKLTAKVAPATSNQDAMQLVLKSSTAAVNESGCDASLDTQKQQQWPQSKSVGGGGRQQPVGVGQPAATAMEALSVQLQSVLTSGNSSNSTPNSASGSRVSTGYQRPQNVALLKTLSSGRETSLVSSLSSQSKRSYRSNDSTDDSSVMHCGHYSVNPASHSPLQQQQLRGCQSRQDSIEAAIKSLVRENEEEEDDDDDDDDEKGAVMSHQVGSSITSGPPAPSVRSKTSNSKSGSSDSNSATSGGIDRKKEFKRMEEFADLDLTAGRPGIKSYRKLPLMSSLVRPLKQPQQQVMHNSATENKTNNVYEQQQPQVNRQQQADSAISSDASSSSATVVAATSTINGGLMAMIRDPERRPTVASVDNLVPQQQQQQFIKWPHGVIPSRVKKLTWDDELSSGNQDADDECFLASHNLRVNRVMASNHTLNSTTFDGNNHQHYDQERLRNNTTEQHFLFSNPCSPSLVADTTGDYICPFIAQQSTNTMMTLCEPAAGRLDQEQLSSLGQNNCFDYTIVQQSQFHVDAFTAAAAAAAASHGNQQQQRPTSYHYSSSSNNNSFVNFGANNQQQQQQQQQQHQSAALPMTTMNQDLNLQMSAAVL